MNRVQPIAVRALALLLAVAAFGGRPAEAQSRLSAVYQQVAFDQRLDAQLPLDVPLRDERGRTVTLGEYLHDRPAILCLVYFQCPMLCNLELEGLIQTLHRMRWSVGEEFQVLTVSFDARETPDMAADKKRAILAQYDRPGAASGWHLLTGDEPSIRQLTEAVGFRFMYDEEQGEFAHASGVVLLTPDGRVSRYLFGIDFPPRDLRLGLVEASEGRIGTPADRLMLLCFAYDPTTGRYGLLVMNLVRLLGLVTILTVGGFIVYAGWRDRRRRRAVPPVARDPLSGTGA